jgi:hypothetical protein
MPTDSCKNQRASVADYHLMTEAIRSSETSILARATRSHITEYGILHSHRRGNRNLIFEVRFHYYIGMSGIKLAIGTKS